MRAAILHGPGDLRIDEVARPVPGPGEVVIDVLAATTCATDVKILANGAHPALGPLPCPLGHEAAGVVSAVGSGVENVRTGDAVIPANSAPCGRCNPCRAGRENLCSDLVYLWGAFAEQLLVPERIVQCNLLAIPTGLSLTHATLAEPLACAVRAIDALDPPSGACVAVLGGGTQGAFLTALLARRDCEVTLYDPHSKWRERARALGAAAAASAPDPASRAPAIVVEAVGRPEAWRQAVELVGRGGRVLFYGGCAPGSHVHLPTDRLHYEEITLAGSYHHDPAAFRAAVGLLADGAIPVEHFLGPPVVLGDLPTVLEKRGPKRPLVIADRPAAPTLPDGAAGHH